MEKYISDMGIEITKTAGGFAISEFGVEFIKATLREFHKRSGEAIEQIDAMILDCENHFDRFGTAGFNIPRYESTTGRKEFIALPSDVWSIVNE